MHPIRNGFLAFTAAALLASGFARAQDKAAALAIVVNPASPLDNVSAAELAKIFKGERAKAPNGAKYVVVSREAGSPEQGALLKSVYKMTAAEYEKYFLQATFAGTVQSAPKQLPGASALRQFVASNTGAIGILRASDADGSVKVVKVDDKLPGDAAYPLKIE